MKSDIPAAELPTISSGDAGKVLKVNSLETGVEWGAESGGTTYTAGDGIDITNDVISADEVWLEDFVNDIINPPVVLNRVNIAEQGSSALIDTYGTTYDMELTQEGKYFVAITNVTLPEAISDQVTYNYFVNTSVGYEMAQITPVWEAAGGGPAGMWHFQGTDSLVQFAMASDDALSAVVRVFYNKPAEEKELPDYSSSDAGKALVVDSNGDLEWDTVGGSSLPADPSVDGTYFLQSVVSSGVATHSWVSLPAANGQSF